VVHRPAPFDLRHGGSLDALHAVSRAPTGLPGRLLAALPSRRSTAKHQGPSLRLERACRCFPNQLRRTHPPRAADPTGARTKAYHSGRSSTRAYSSVDCRMREAGIADDLRSEPPQAERSRSSGECGSQEPMSLQDRPQPRRRTPPGGIIREPLVRQREAWAAAPPPLQHARPAEVLISGQHL